MGLGTKAGPVGASTLPRHFTLSSPSLRYLPPNAGLMADFADQTPFSPYASFGTVPAAVGRALLPEAWQQTCRLAASKAGLEGQVVYWTRSAGLRTPAYATLVWLGDQNPTWDAFDGIKSAFIATLNAGLAGLTMTHSDIGECP